MADRDLRSVALCVLVAALFDCSPPITQRCESGANVGGFGGGFGGTGTGGGSSAGEPIGLVGKPMELTLDTLASTACEPQWSVEGEVLDPRNLAVAAEFIRAPGIADFASARVRFTPVTAGPYLVTGRFEPSLARVQRIVQVARDRSMETPIIDPMPFSPGECGQVFRTLRGSVVCQRGAAVAVVRSGVMLESFANTTANVVGNTVWLVTKARLERRVDTGMGPLALAGSVAATFELSANASFFDDDRAIVLDGFNLRGPLVWDGTRLVDEQRQFRAGNGLLLGASAFSFDGDSLCDASADGGSCQQLIPVGVQGDAVWTSDDSKLSYRVGRGASQGSLPLSPQALVDPLSFPLRGNQTPRVRMVTGELFTAVLTADGPVFELLPPPTELFTRDFAVIRRTPTSISWLRR